MHKTALDTARLFFELYASDDAVIAELGSLNVTGSLRDVAPKARQYIGMDFAKGPGVDVILTDPYKLPLADNSVDVCVSSSCFEHSEFFWLLFLEMLRILKPGGVLYFSAPSNGQFHRYPVDCWRFYPDSGRALERWARVNGLRTLMLESFTGLQDWQPWNDFVAVFVKDERFAGQYPNRIMEKYPHTNGLVAGSDDLVNYNEWPQDQRGPLRSAYRYARLMLEGPGGALAEGRFREAVSLTIAPVKRLLSR